MVKISRNVPRVIPRNTKPTYKIENFKNKSSLRMY